MTFHNRLVLLYSAILALARGLPGPVATELAAAGKRGGWVSWSPDSTVLYLADSTDARVITLDAFSGRVVEYAESAFVPVALYRVASNGCVFCAGNRLTSNRGVAVVFGPEPAGAATRLGFGGRLLSTSYDSVFELLYCMTARPGHDSAVTVIDCRSFKALVTLCFNAGRAIPVAVNGRTIIHRKTAAAGGGRSEPAKKSAGVLLAPDEAYDLDSTLPQRTPTGPTRPDSSAVRARSLESGDDDITVVDGTGDDDITVVDRPARDSAVFTVAGVKPGSDSQLAGDETASVDWPSLANWATSRDRNGSGRTEAGTTADTAKGGFYSKSSYKADAYGVSYHLGGRWQMIPRWRRVLDSLLADHRSYPYWLQRFVVAPTTALLFVQPRTAVRTVSIAVRCPAGRTQDTVRFIAPGGTVNLSVPIHTPTAVFQQRVDCLPTGVYFAVLASDCRQRVKFVRSGRI